ncbi:MAG: diaminopimelate epimerase [Candidatus Omnitrophica bacterium]|nr:diaminopimelate epimerase [Candidatus Omnitrophota bacterium]MCF7894191.1 diaminopimelate epimerase [Candidatus Omnitrophota bacterium]
MKKINFYKLQASGNDFILIDKGNFLKDKGKRYLSAFAKKYCVRKQGIGADGLLVVEPSKISDFKMRIFNADGTEAEMCGNGARCVALWRAYFSNLGLNKRIRFNTKAGIIEANLASKIKEDKNLISARIKAKITKPFGLIENIPLKVLGRKIKVNFINTGVPHVVIFVEGLDNIEVEKIGRPIRFHQHFFPQGVNVDFVEPLDDDKIKIRTYERGVEAETLACGTGTIASAILFSIKKQKKDVKVTSRQKVRIQTKGGELLKANFRLNKGQAEDVWFEGKAFIVYEGQFKNKGIR